MYPPTDDNDDRYGYSEEINVNGLIDHESDNDENDEPLEESEETRLLDRILIEEGRKESAINPISNETELFGDEEPDTTIQDSSVEPPPIVLPNNSKPSRNLRRGRYGRIALDDNNEPLPPPKILELEQNPEPKLRVARLTGAYFRKREDPEVQRQRRELRQSTSLLDFQATFDQISIIVDKDDKERKGYQHACRRLDELQPNLSLNQIKAYYDLWNFGLFVHSIPLQKSITCDLRKIIPDEINNEDKRPFWFTFKTLPNFCEMKPTHRTSKILKTSPNSKEPRGTSVSLDFPITADLSSGALTSMSRFCAHKDYVRYKQNRWQFYFQEDFFEIRTFRSQINHENSSTNLTLVKYKIPLDIIDRTAIIFPWNDGFSLFINMKGNIHELHQKFTFRKRDSINKDDDYPYEPFVRQGIDKGKVQPLFSTIRLRIQLKNDEFINELSTRKNLISSSMSSDEINQILQDIREESLDDIRRVFNEFLEFFSRNRIHVCFGLIRSSLPSLEQLATLNSREFSTFIQAYSWAMLNNIGFRLQNLILSSKTFINNLYEYSYQCYQGETPADIDDRFYRLCLYLYRRSLEYIFLDLDAEILNGIEEYKIKYDRIKQRKLSMPHFMDVSSSTAYIPSVVLTPTIIKIRPLKLCKLNRVLREKRFGSFLNFALIELRDEAQRSLFPSVFRALKVQIFKYLTDGFEITPRRTYQYLHHSQSQVKCKQFWFYHHDRKQGYLSHADAYTWMGNFDKERMVAKHAARIALCFTSTEPTIQIPAEQVTYVRDVQDAKKLYTFTDGVGTISSRLRDKIQEYLGKPYQFSVIQIRYGGCKGTLSVDPNLDEEEYQLRLRDSMNKFNSDHDILEVCKLSAPRALYLNRQDIVLLESRDVPHTNFLSLQNEDHFRLIQALLTPEKAFELLNDKLLPVFQLRKIARRLNIVKEPFFIRLIITCAFNIIRELIDRTRIRIENTKARNMFGIVDEYGVLESGQVFVQYSSMRDNRLNITAEEEYANRGRCEIRMGQVVITKNPCHHPGDLRVFDAVDRPELRHLKDVVVFPQKGDRPHSNEISGSDLDGDEYVVIWLDDLIPKTRNEKAYAYDSQGDPEKLDRPITRDDINEVVMRVSEQDCLGTLSNIHLAYADKFGIKSEVCTKLAGAISQEVDAAKTGQHPLSEQQILELRQGLNNQWPDFMKARGKKEYYRSERVLGKLYRSARRAVSGWSRAINNYGNVHHMDLLLALTDGTDIQHQSTQQFSSLLDPNIFHPQYEKYLPEIKKLYRMYREELLEIISLYRFQDEIDLFCRSDSMDASAGGSKKGSLEDSAAIEVTNLVERIKGNFYHEFEERMKARDCSCHYEEIDIRDGRTIWKRRDCDECAENKLMKAACAYIHCYKECDRLPVKSSRRIMSFPWLFAGQLLYLREQNNREDFSHLTDTIVGPACVAYLSNFTAKCKVSILSNSLDNDPLVELYYEKLSVPSTSQRKTNSKLSIPFLRVCFIEILNDWLIKQKIFGNNCLETESKPLVPESIWHELIIHFLSNDYQDNVRLLPPSKYQKDLNERYNQMIRDYSSRWTTTEYNQLLKMFDEIHRLTIQHANETKLPIWTYLDEYILLALQCIAIERRLVDNWIRG